MPESWPSATCAKTTPARTGPLVDHCPTETMNASVRLVKNSFKTKHFFCEMVLAYYQTNIQSAGKFQEAKMFIKSASKFSLAKTR
jgi:hypothetical protein